MRSSAISVDGTMATATTTKTEMSMATATDRIVGGGTHAAGVRRTMSGSTEGGWGEGMTTNAVRLPRRTRSARRPNFFIKNDDRNGEGICLWRFVDNNRTEDDTNNDDVGERGATTSDDRDNGGNSKEDRVNNDNDGGNNWRDVDVDNDGGGVASLFPCLTPIIVESSGEFNGGEEEEERATSPALTKTTTT